MSATANGSVIDENPDLFSQPASDYFGNDADDQRNPLRR
jgi:hypothetical protein